MPRPRPPPKTLDLVTAFKQMLKHAPLAEREKFAELVEDWAVKFPISAAQLQQSAEQQYSPSLFLKAILEGCDVTLGPKELQKLKNPTGQ